jgi:hypothetical protein
MAKKSKSETGHAVFVSQFFALINLCKMLGNSYNPSNQEISIPKLQAWLVLAKAALKAVNVAAIPWMRAVNARDLAFKPLDHLVTLIMNAVQACGADEDYVKDVHTICRKLQGKRATPIIVTVPGDPNTPTDESVKQISASQKGFDNRINNLDKLLQLLSSEPKYIPNETNLTTASISNVLDNLNSVNDKVMETYPELSIAIINRNKLLYMDLQNGSDLSGKVKHYIRSAFGPKSPEFAKFAALEFHNPIK